MVPFGIVWLKSNDVGDELGIDREEDEASPVETTVDVCTQANSISDII